MHRRTILTIIFLVATVLMFTVQVRISSSARPGSIMFINESLISFEHSNLLIKQGVLNKGDKVRLLFDPGSEDSIDDNGQPLKMETPHRRVEVEVLTGAYEGKIGWVSLMNLSKKIY